MYKAFLVEGLVNVAEALASAVDIEAVYATPSGRDALRQNGGAVAGRLDALAVHEVGETELARLSTQQQPHGAVAVLPALDYANHDFGAHDRLLYLDGLADPGNAGTLLRTAEWFGVGAALAAEGTVEWTNPKVVAAARGSLFRLPVGTVAAADLAARFPRHRVMVADLAGERYDRFAWPPRAILVLGSESHGPSAELKARATAISIPSHGAAPTESLNVAVAGGILLASWAAA